MSDQEIIEIYNNTKIIKGKQFKTLKLRNPEIYEYLMNRYNDYIGNECPTEIVYRIINHIDVRPTCVVCGNPILFSKSKGRYDKHFCSKKCEHTKKGLKIVKSIVQDIKEKKYGNRFYNNRDKYKETCLERFGYTNPNKNPKIIESAKITRNKTMIEKYGDITYNNKEKIMATKIARYGSTSYNNHEKLVKTMMDLYGTTSYNNREKAEETCLEKYGVKNPMHYEPILNKMLYTKLDRYGSKGYNNHEKSKETCLERYGVENPQQVPEINQKAFYTRYKTNPNSIISKIENEVLNYITKYIDNNTISLYISELYPFHCDFYLHKYDLYIELNAMWTHGPHAFNKNNQDDLILLKYWLEKSESSSFYKQAIEIWTKTDPLKLSIAQKNNIRYLPIYSNNFEEIITIINLYIQQL